MIEFEWEKDGTREDAAALLRKLADSLAGDGEVEIEHEGWELKLTVPDKLEMELELKAGDDATELEIELKWSRGKPSAAAGRKGSTGSS